MMHQYSIPEDIVFEILLRLPAKSIGRFTCVSKSWARIIHSDVFMRSFSFKKQQPHFLFAFNDLETLPKQNLLWEIFSIFQIFLPKSNDRVEEGYQENWRFYSKLTREFLSNTECQSKKLRYEEPSYVHGLISFLYDQEQVVSNPTTGKSITLPTVSNPIIRSFLGYDPIDAKYKVLCLTNVNHQVLTLGGSGPQIWRTIISCSTTPHHPSRTDSLCINGVLYYTASSGSKQLLVGFELRSETLEITSILPEEDKTTLINYHGKIALVTRVDSYGAFNLWILEDAKKQDWSKQVLSFPLNENDIDGGPYGLEILGFSERGEFVCALNLFEELYVYFLDHIRNKVTKVKVRARGNTKHDIRNFFKVFILLNHVESLMFMQRK